MKKPETHKFKHFWLSIFSWRLNFIYVFYILSVFIPHMFNVKIYFELLIHTILIFIIENQQSNISRFISIVFLLYLQLKPYSERNC